MVNALLKEIYLRKEENTASINSIYFGGGTPSILNLAEIEDMIEAIYNHYTVSKSPEITVEVNPDDVNLELLKGYKKLGVNRLSIGIQTFNDRLLRYINRVHSSAQGIKAIQNSRSAGFENISTDLIYGIPGSDKKNLESDLQQIGAFSPEHISVYGFTLEEKTVFGKWHKMGKLNLIEENTDALLYEHIIERLPFFGYDHYEISNFCLPGFESKHNKGYWTGESYIGIGPGAHSFDGEKRCWNLLNNHRYMQSINNNITPLTYDNRNAKDAINEYIFTSLRTKWGCNIDKVRTLWGTELMDVHKPFIKNLLTENLAIIKHDHIILTNKGKLLADHIASELMID